MSHEDTLAFLSTTCAYRATTHVAGAVAMSAMTACHKIFLMNNFETHLSVTTDCIIRT